MIGSYYRPKGRKYFIVRFPWKGEEIRVTSYKGWRLRDEEIAQACLGDMRGEYNSGTFDPANWWKEKALLFHNAWRQYQEQRLVGKARMDQREYVFTNYLLPYFRDKNLKEIEEYHINDWWHTVLENGFKPSYIRLIRATLRAFLNFHRVTRVKALAFPIVKIPRLAVPWLTQKEQLFVLESIPHQHQGIVRFLCTYGCRPSEICNLRKSDIDWGKKIITFRDRKAGDDNTLPLLPEIEAILRAPKRVESMEYVFCRQRGSPYTRQVLYQIWAAANLKAHIKYGVKIVALKNGTRHSKASQLRSQGESLGVIARILGNSEKVVEQAYGRVSIEKVGEVLEMKGREKC